MVEGRCNPWRRRSCEKSPHLWKGPVFHRSAKKLTEGEIVMKKAFLLFALVLCLATLVVAAVDFSGTWVLDPSKSDQRMGRGGRGGGEGGPGGGAPVEITMSITMTGNEMTVSRTTPAGANETKYVLDGKENTATTQRGDLKYKAVWEGSSLVISGTTSTQRGDRPMKEAYSLSADGKELTIARTTSGQQGETVRKQVFNKK
jgi:hypothetical protein